MRECAWIPRSPGTLAIQFPASSRSTSATYTVSLISGAIGCRGTARDRARSAAVFGWEDRRMNRNDFLTNVASNYQMGSALPHLAAVPTADELSKLGDRHQYCLCDNSVSAGAEGALCERRVK